MKFKHDKSENNGEDNIRIFKDDNYFNEYSDYFIDLLNERMIYLTGNITFANPAVDNLFFFPEIDKTNYVKIERLVEIYDPINEIWEPLILRGNINININIYLFYFFLILFIGNKNNYHITEDDNHNSIKHYHRNFSVSIQNDNFIDINFDHVSYIFPMITCQTFFPKEVN